ncbi:GNAT family N-acetyltransferase [Actinopolymorpha sp. NPDC004070]|uniref:bifunctional acetate--CoA ligase family protein/GNAT family N-acetyltransferase n=1 Tax=Actinopolymorpha sp. NPDC004070 TaxID=3154548 RepID=UPI0033B18D22
MEPDRSATKVMPDEAGQIVQTVPSTGQAVRAVLTDGRVVELRPLGPDDLDDLVRLHQDLPERDTYLRFFTTHPVGLPELLGQLVRPGDAHRLTVGAFAGQASGHQLIGAAHCEVLSDPAEAEVAIVVDHRQQAHGLGTLLLEHLASAARRRGVRRFVAEVLTENAAMVRVFRDAGLPMTMRLEGSSYLVTLRLVEGATSYAAAVGERERLADVASLGALLRPKAVAVVGAGRRPESVGHAVLANLLAGGYTGAVHAVNPHADVVADVRCVPSARDLPAGVDLAILCVPAAAVAQAAEECGERGVRALVVITSGVTDHPELADALRAAVRKYGMRMVGPNCLGVINTAEDVRLNATFARGPAPAGRVGVVTQSGGVGIALLEQFAAVELGVSSLVSTGDKFDVSSNDLLMWWQRDEATDLAVIYVESFGNPRKFGVLARALAARKPVLAVRTGTSEVARRAAASHTAASATPAVNRDALFDQAGVLAMDHLSDVVATACVLSWQPLPTGNRVAVIGNVGGIGVLAADACARQGLTLPDLNEVTRAELRALLPPTASLRNPVDTTADVPDEIFHRCVRAVLDDPGVDAVLVLTAPTAVTDPLPRLADEVPWELGLPVVAVRVGQTAVVDALHPTDPAAGRPVPVFSDPAHAAVALGKALRYGSWRARPAGTVPDLPNVDVDAARALVAEFLTAHPDGGWLDPELVVTLLGHVGLPVAGVRVVRNADEAVAAFHECGRPVALKAAAADALHKSRAGGVLLGLSDEAAVRHSFDILRERFGPALTGVVVQPMAAPGRELLVGVSSDPTFGPLVAFGLGGVDTDLVGDRTYRMVPLTDLDAREMLTALRAGPALFGENADPRLDTDGIVEVLLRVGRLAELVPEVAELDLNPVVATTASCVVVDARVRLAPAEPGDPFLRRLRT